MSRRKPIACILCQENLTTDHDGICYSCRVDWEKGRELRQLVENEGGGETQEIFSSVSYWYIYPWAGENRWDIARDPQRFIQSTLLKLAGAQSVGSPYNRRSYFFPPEKMVDEKIGITSKVSRENLSFEYFMAPRGTATMLQEVYKSIVDLLAKAYAEGSRNGGHMLKKLATGQATIEEYNKWFTQNES